VTRSVSRRIRASGIGNGNAMFMLTPMTDTVPPAAAHISASVIVASAPTASMTACAPRPPVASSTFATVCPSLASIGSAPRSAARARRSGTMSTASTRDGPNSWAACSANTPTGPRPMTTTVSPGWMSARRAPR
jgi:hypothetical protein